MQQSTKPSFPSDEIIRKLIYSGNEADYKLGVTYLLHREGLINEVPTSLDYYHFSRRSVEVYKITGDIQKEVVIGQTGWIIRKIRSADNDSDFVKKHWR